MTILYSCNRAGTVPDGRVGVWHTAVGPGCATDEADEQRPRTEGTADVLSGPNEGSCLCVTPQSGECSEAPLNGELERREWHPGDVRQKEAAEGARQQRQQLEERGRRGRATTNSVWKRRRRWQVDLRAGDEGAGFDSSNGQRASGLALDSGDAWGLSQGYSCGGYDLEVNARWR
ncbi:hypothetical protein F444_11972 [Phytophthora nicotianae P1976]|uniref:Uncharacterized protein n=1 Tax=Phytophthora nicotianae P1976 TaxID=1317066 RepID=A0A080ZYM9_PHYNI|nr:hypothetical protein F444_11972 [Phytophthora nicotianae P1976]